MLTRVTIRRVAAAAVALAAATTASLVVAGPASAAQSLEIDYHTTGSTKLSNPNSHAKLTFAPSLMQSYVTFQPDNTAKIKAYLPLAPVTTAFKAYGFLPAKGTVVFTQVGAATGTLGTFDQATGFPLAVTARYVISLRNVFIGGANANVGFNCQSVNPITVTISAQPGFDLVNGVLNGNYDLGKFNNCGAGQTIINDTVPGTGNSLTLDIHFGDDAASAAGKAIAAAKAKAVASHPKGTPAR